MVHFSGLMCVDLHGKRKDVIRLAMYSRFFLFALQVSIFYLLLVPSLV